MTPTALIVDDDQKFQTFVSRTLTGAGFGVVVARDGSEVSDVLASRHIDVLVLDLQMPGMNGWEVMRGLRDRGHMSPKQAGQSPKVVVLSGRSEGATQAFARRLGADAYLTKPLRGAELVATLQHVLAA